MFTLVGSRDNVVYIYSPDIPKLMNGGGGYYLNGLRITPDPYQNTRDALFEYDADNVHEHIHKPFREAVNQ